MYKHVQKDTVLVLKYSLRLSFQTFVNPLDLAALMRKKKAKTKSKFTIPRYIFQRKCLNLYMAWCYAIRGEKTRMSETLNGNLLLYDEVYIKEGNSFGNYSSFINSWDIFTVLAFKRTV